jgi:hypothetical protein
MRRANHEITLNEIANRLQEMQVKSPCGHAAGRRPWWRLFLADA